MAIIAEGGSRRLRAGRAGWNPSRRRARPVAEILETRQLLATIIVNSAGDADGADGSATLSLRQAIEVSNGSLAISSLTESQASLVVDALSTPNTIDFAIPGTGPFTIMPAKALPTITSPVVIDGYSETGAHPNTNGPGQGKNTVIQIEIDGANAPAGTNGLDVQAGDSTVQGLAIGGFTVSNASGSPVGGDGILLEMQTGDLIQGNFIGSDFYGDPLPNGIGIEDTHRYVTQDLIPKPIGGFNTIGGTAAGAGNVISGNSGAGLELQGEYLLFFVDASVSDLVEGNFIGTSASGAQPLPNGSGIEDYGGGGSGVGESYADVTGSTIGGTAAGAGNVISGNSGDGLGIFGNFVFGGYVGSMSLVFPSQDLVQGNLIGTDVTGSQPLPNSGNGVSAGGYGITIGGTAKGAGNIISGNTGDGLAFSDGLGGSYYGGASVLVDGNHIGTNLTGIDPIPNGGDGILFSNSKGSSTVGATTSGASNVIAFNAGSGVEISSTLVPLGGLPTLPTFVISGNSIFANGKLGINYTSADQGDFTTEPPVLQSVTPEGAGSMISGTLDANPSNTYAIEFFSNVIADPSGSGQGQTYLGSAFVTTDASGHASFTFTSTMPLLNLYVSATATKTAGPGGGLGGLYPLNSTTEFAKNLLGYTATTTTTLVAPSSPTMAGQPTTFAAVVASPGGVPTGEVNFLEDGVVIGSAPLNASGIATFVIAPLTPGPHTITAAFQGDISHAASQSSAVAVNVLAPIAVTVLGPNRIATQGQPITFAASVTSSGTVPTGQVAFLEDGVVLGSSPLGATGLASFVTDQLLPGPHVITAEYLGNSIDPASLSNAVAVQVFNATAFGGPAVTSDVFSGSNAVTVTFNRGLFIGPAQDPANYKIMGPRRQAIKIVSAVYNPSNASVTLTTAQPLDPHKTYHLTINGQKGDRVVDVFGIALNGKTKGKPGHNYSGKIKVKKVPVVKVTHASSTKVKVHTTAHNKGR